MKAPFYVETCTWEGAYAGIYVRAGFEGRDPVSLRFSPALEDGDRPAAINAACLAVTVEYHALLRASPRTKEQDIRLNVLSGLLEAA